MINLKYDLFMMMTLGGAVVSFYYLEKNQLRYTFSKYIY